MLLLFEGRVSDWVARIHQIFPSLRIQSQIERANPILELSSSSHIVDVNSGHVFYGSKSCKGNGEIYPFCAIHQRLSSKAIPPVLGLLLWPTRHCYIVVSLLIKLFRVPPTVHWKQGYRGQFHILHWILLLFCSSDEIKVGIQYFKVVSIHFMSNVWLKAHFPQKSLVIWWKICIFDTKNLIPRYSTTFQLPNYLNMQKMNKITS